MNNYKYIGTELELFSEAYNWKEYCQIFLNRYLGNTVLEVGAGIGSTTLSLCQGKQEQWICLEPDLSLAQKLQLRLNSGELPKCCKLRIGTLLDILPDELFDTIIYIDVLEHIEDHRSEVILASQHLEKNGKLVILAPAHQCLYTPFDKAIGHFRRYSKKTLSNLFAPNLNLATVSMSYLDSVGLFASLANRLILKSKMPTRKQIKLWDEKMIPISKKIDPILGYSIGKTIVGIWLKKE